MHFKRVQRSSVRCNFSSVACSLAQWKDILPWRPELGPKVKFWEVNKKQRSFNGRGGGAQRPVWHSNEPKKMGARSARARTRGQNPLVQYKCLVLIYVFPEMKLWSFIISKQNYNVLCPSLHNHVFVSDLYIPGTGLPYWHQKNRQTYHGREYINRSKIHECRNWKGGRTVSFLGIHKSDFRCSVLGD